MDLWLYTLALGDKCSGEVDLEREVGGYIYSYFNLTAGIRLVSQVL